jgi:hypothetical protein
MRLNLGCGRAQFPTTKDNPFVAHQIGYLEQFVPSALEKGMNWVNVDTALIEGVDCVLDLFEYPWPWKDNSVDEVWCSHIVEHIPHYAELISYTDLEPSDTLRRAAKLDGWYAFFYEVWRVLKPGGVVHVVAPYAWSSAAVLDPTHTRMVAPGSFSYFVPNPNAPFDYQIPAQFEQTDVQLMPTSLGLQIVGQLGNDTGSSVAMRTIDAISEFYIGLKAVK